MTGKRKYIFIIMPPLFGVVARFMGPILQFDPFRSMVFGIATTCLCYIAEMAWLISDHDKTSKIHYAEAMKRYNTLTEMGEKVIHRALVDVETLVEVIATDMKKILDLKELTDRNLLFHLVKLDLETLKVRLVEIHNDGSITLDNHQLKSHRIICEVMDEENIKEYSAIYDARTNPIQLDKYDEAFADALDDMVSAKKVIVNGLIVIADDATDEIINDLITDLVPYYNKEGYTLSYIKNKQFERGCSAAFTDDNAIQHITRYPDVGIYGDRYVYVGVPVQDGDIQRGRFERKAVTVNKYLALSRYCLSHATTILPSSVAASAATAGK